ncbi:protein Flattop homolog [Actinia tenebrosa]|uniref:Cilia- and flagella-associated protein 126 n=1 Tax=Actinia tenebrosa TaxID=6105 RepID=A0A6P8I3Q2_ACTTE|nr:protein Flattop homolog [Actinia tenebrosa]
MSTHFSANQYEQAFAAKRLQNWEVPQRFKERPSTLEGFTRIISNDRGHILEGIPRSSKSPWGEFVGTWEMQKPPLRTKTLKTKAMAEKMHNEEKARTPSPTKLRTPSPQCASPVPGSPSPRGTPIENKSPSRLSASPRKTPQLRTPSPQKTPEPARSPSPRHTLVDRKSPVKETDN